MVPLSFQFLWSFDGDFYQRKSQGFSFNVINKTIMKLSIIFLKEDRCFTQFPVTFNISVEHQEWEDNKDVLDDLMLSLKQNAHSCDLKCFEEVS